jgi:hypothetical protein
MQRRIIAFIFQLEQAFLRRLTGVRLKDESDNPALHGKIKPLPPFTILRLT